MIQDYTAVIQAGGRGTRMEGLTGNKIPKPMLLLNGKPMLEWQIENIKKYGVSQFIIIIGYLGDKIKEYFGDGSRLGINLRYIEEKEPLGSAGALFFLKPMLCTDDFLLVFGDVMFDVDLDRMARFYENHKGEAALLAHPNAHPYDSDLLIMGSEDRVEGIDSKHNKRDYWYENCVNAGIYMLSASILKAISQAHRLDLEQDVLLPLMNQGKVYAYRTPEYVKDAGTPERFYKACEEQRNGVWERKNLSAKQACVFLDRDGTVNKYQGLISSEDRFELEESAAKAIRRLNEAGFLVIVVTNQPVIARGMCGIHDVERIHRKMQVLLGESGAYVDDIAFCPHHPDKGYPEENPDYKIVCRCRKPATGMIDDMAEAYHIDLSRSYMVGDTTVDIETGRRAGLHTVLVLTGQAGKDGKYDAVPEMTADDLGDAADRIIENRKR